jgi:hypothetical protein
MACGGVFILTFILLSNFKMALKGKNEIIYSFIFLSNEFVKLNLPFNLRHFQGGVAAKSR